MHELSLMEGVLEIIQASADKEGFAHVRRVILRIGALSGVEPEAMRFCFDSVVAGTLAEGAELEILEVPGLGLCQACGRTGAMETRFDPCPHCGRVQMQVTSGTEMRIEALDVE